MSDNTILGTKPFSDYMSVAEAASKVMNLDEHCGICDEQGLKEETTPKQMSSDEKLKWFNKLKSGQTIKLWYDSSMAKGSAWREFKLGRKTKSAKYNLEKISMQMMKDGKAGGVKFFLYNRQGKISMAWGDMGVTLISISEEVEMDEAKGTAYPPTIENLRMIVKDKQHQKFMFDKGQAIVDTFTASAMIAVYDAMKKPEIKKKFEEMIKSKEGFMKTQAFAMKMIK